MPFHCPQYWRRRNHVDVISVAQWVVGGTVTGEHDGVSQVGKDRVVVLEESGVSHDEDLVAELTNSGPRPVNTVRTVQI